MTRTAWTYSRMRSVSDSPRIRRADSQDVSPMTRISSVSVGGTDRDQDEQQEQDRNREQRVDDAHHDAVDEPPKKPAMAPQTYRPPSRLGRRRSRPRVRSDRRP